MYHMQVDLTQLSLFRICQNETAVSEIKRPPTSQLTILSIFLPEVAVSENIITYFLMA
jgi:hypothetical protein